MKKILTSLFISFTLFTFAQNITLTTTSNSATWSPQTVTKSGGVLTWTATGAALAGSPVVINANDPTFDFSSNNGSPITIEITSPDGFNGLTALDFWVPTSGGLISVLDVSNATALLSLNTRYNVLTGIDLSQNTVLQTYIMRGNRQLGNQPLNTTNNSQLGFLWVDGTGINSVDLSNNPLLLDVRLYNNRLTSAVLDQVLIDLDAHGLSDGNLQIANQTTGQSITIASSAAYNNLIAKGWAIDVLPPQPDTEAPVIGVLNTPTNITTNSMTLNWSAATDNVAVTNYNIYKNGVLEVQVGNVLTYEVTGLSPNTLYNFYITALDATPNESGNSNTVQGTTLQAPTGTTITLTTTSNSATWSPQTVTKSGGVLTWTATGAALAGSPVLINANDPTFNFSSNNGSPITIEITSPDGFNGLTALDFWVPASGGLISVLDVSNATALLSLNTRYNVLTGIDLSQNTVLQTYIMRGNRQLNNQPLNTTNNTQLSLLWVDGTGINSVDLSNNPLLLDVRLYNNRLTSAVLDQVLIDLDTHGLSDGNLQITNQTTGQSITTAAFAAYNNLIAKGWAIDVLPPQPDTEAPVIGVLNTPTNITTNSMTLNWSAATDNVAVTNYNIYKNGVLEVQVGNVLTYEVTGLSPNTLYNFYITALDATPNESGNSNTVQGTTLQAPTGTTITLTTTSNSATWSPQTVTKSGGVLTWTATGAALAGSPVLINANDPTFNFSSNNGSPITIEITSPDGFNGLTALDFWVPASGGLISVLDVSNATALLSLNTRYNVLTGIDLSQNTVLQTYIMRGNRQLNNQPLNTTNNTQLSLLWIDGTGINSVDLSNNPLLLDVRLYNNRLTSAVLDQVLIDLDTHGLSDGNLQIINQTTGQSITPAAFTAYNNLIAKGWTIDVGPPLSEGPHIQVTGNGINITSTNTPDLADGTAFGETTLGNPLSHTFVINNIGTEDLILGPLFISTSSVFPITLPVSNLTIPAGGSESFEVTFNPVALGVFTGSILIQTNDPDIAAFVLNMTGEAVQVLSNQIMITQYYEGFGPNDRWIEVKNISGSAIGADTYYLALFNQTLARAGVIDVSVPTSSIAIPALSVDETILFRNASAALPSAGNIGSATQINLPANFIFDGDDVILISTSNAITSYNLRVDMMGDISSSELVNPDVWGNNSCFIKGGCSTEEAHKSFNINDWTFIALVDVDNALANTNLALGTQVVGPTTTTDGISWSNLDPDQSRTAIISSSLNGAAETFYACNLIVNSGADVVFDSNGGSSNSIVLYGDLTVNGSLTIGDTESLVTFDNGATLGAITKIEKSQPATSIYDATYWSSPVNNQQLSTVFAGVDPNRIFEFKAGDVNPKYAGTNYKYWWIASGAMEQAIGYSADASALGIQTITFNGVPYNGSISKNLRYSGSPDIGPDANENFNLIGNPYPAAIDIQMFLEDNSAVNEIALWAKDKDPNPDGTFNPAGYIYYSTIGTTTPGVTQNIGSGQGFMARAVSDNAVTFTNGFKLVGQNTQFYKSVVSKSGKIVEGNQDRIWLRLKDGKVKSDILVGFLEEATDGIDMKYEAFGGLDNSNIRLYSQIGDSKLAIQALGSFSPEKSVTLGFDIKEAKELTLSINGLEGVFVETDVYLVDHVLNKTHNLKESDYTFNQTTTGDISNRFTLQFSKNAVDADKILQGSEFSVFNSAEGFRINASKVVKEVKVYDMLGRTIIDSKPDQQSFYLNASNLKTGAVLIFEVKLENGVILNKKAIKM